jgi:ABC-type Fe3+/spermidine/putrescine transport system ATPase subunit
VAAHERGHNIGYGLRMQLEEGWIAERIGEMLKLLQLEGFGSRSVTQLSGGQRQRVALGRALAVSPHVLLLDEPMSNLDYKVRLELRHELRALQQRIGITAVYVTHDREEALTLSDRIAVIDTGRIVQTGAPEEIFHRPTSAFVAGFMGADNALDVVLTGDGAFATGAATAGGSRVRAHFRSDAVRVRAPPASARGIASGEDPYCRASSPSRVRRPGLSLSRARRRRGRNLRARPSASPRHARMRCRPAYSFAIVSAG